MIEVFAKGVFELTMIAIVLSCMLVGFSFVVTLITWSIAMLGDFIL